MKAFGNSVRHRICPFCAAPDIRRLGPLKYANPVVFSTTTIALEHPAELWRCLRCDSGFIQNALRSADAYALYGAGDSTTRWTGGTGFVVEKDPEVVAVLSRLFGTGTCVADIGCGAGQLLDFAASRGCATVGIELSTNCHAVLQARGHQMQASLDDLTDGSLQVICAFDLVEHLYDFNGFLAGCRRKLAPGGAVAILTGDIRSLSARLARHAWWYSGYPEHIGFPSPRLFAGLPGWRLETALPCYASRGYRSPLPRALIAATRRLLRGNYNGLPSLGADHRLYVLRHEALPNL